MLKMYREDNEDADFKFIHVFKRIEKCDKWAVVRESLGKGKDAAFDPTAPLPAAGQGCPEMGNKKAKQAREDAPVMDRLQSSIDKCIAGVATNNAARKDKEAAREVKFDARWAMMFEKQEGPPQDQCHREQKEGGTSALDRRYLFDVRRGEGVAQGVVQDHLC
jgi:hypothetical protein